MPVKNQNCQMRNGSKEGRQRGMCRRTDQLDLQERGRPKGMGRRCGENSTGGKQKTAKENRQQIKEQQLFTGEDLKNDSKIMSDLELGCEDWQKPSS